MDNIFKSPKIISLKKQIKELSKELTLLKTKILKLVKEFKKESAQMIKDGFVPTIEFVMSNNGYELDGLGPEFYNAKNKELKKECPNLKYSGIYTTEPFQTALEIMLYEGTPHETYVKQINRVLPLMCKHDGKSKRIHLFEHTLSEYGVYDIRTEDDIHWYLTVTTYGHTKTIKEFQTLDECIIYCCKNHYYQ